MKLENQVCTIEQAKKLKELGVIASAIWYWVFPAKEKMLSTKYGLYYHEQASDILSDNDGDEFDHASAPAYGVAELGVMLGKHVKEIFFHGPTKMWSQNRGMNPDLWNHQAHCYANWIIHLIEQRVIPVEEINQRLQNS